MATLREVEDLVLAGDFRAAVAVLNEVPPSQARDDYAEMFFRVWSYSEGVGLRTMMGGDDGTT